MPMTNEDEDLIYNSNIPKNLNELLRVPSEHISNKQNVSLSIKWQYKMFANSKLLIFIWNSKLLIFIWKLKPLLFYNYKSRNLING